MNPEAMKKHIYAILDAGIDEESKAAMKLKHGVDYTKELTKLFMSGKIAIEYDPETGYILVSRR